MSVLAPEYVAFSQELPPGSKSIWEIIETDLDHFALQVEKDEDRLVIIAKFLARFFSRRVVAKVLRHVEELKESVLGADYTLEKPLALLGLSVIDGLRELGGVKSAAGQQQKRQQHQEPVYPAGRSSGGSSGGGTGGSGNEDFKAWPTVECQDKHRLIVLKRSPRGTGGRGYTIRTRSTEFLAVVGPRSGLLYDPWQASNRKVSIYHGTRAAQLANFAYEGINPMYNILNEFWGGPAFYCCNSVQYAYEFPLHYHLGQGTDDSIAVLEFKVEAAVLNGKEAPSPGESRFSVKWFQHANERWEKWVAYHMLPREDRRKLKLRKEDSKDWDIVIGPVCFGGPSAEGRVSPVHLNTAGVALTQAAFCSNRAQAWLQRKFCQVHMERRCAEE